MLQCFLRRAKTSYFRTRSAASDMHADGKVLGAVGRAIDEALTALETEKAGLSHRLNEVRDRASIAVGAEHDEYLSRETVLLTHLQAFEQEMMRATQRLKHLNERIAALRFVRTAFHFRFSTLDSACDRAE